MQDSAIDTLGRVMKEWRQIRRVSQLDLSVMAGVSARHISFLETGRSQPTRGMVLRLSEVLNMPPSARNRMLIAAGMAPTTSRQRLSEADLAPLKQAVHWMLQNHAPYPGLALDSHWRIVALNAPAQKMIAGSGLSEGDSMLEAFLHNAALRSALVNLEEVERFMCARLRTELVELGRDEVIEAALAQLEARHDPRADVPFDPGVVVTARYRFGDGELSLFSTISHFGGANDDMFSELKIELMFPADAATGAALRALSEM